MKLNLSCIHGGKNKLCGCASVEMILSYYKIAYNEEDIANDLQEVQGGTDMPQIGRVLMRYGLSVHFVSMHPHLFTIKDKSLSQDEIERKIERLIEFPVGSAHDQITLKNLYAFMQEGGIVAPLLPSAKMVINELKNQRPVLAFFPTRFMSGGSSVMNDHPIVLIGYDTEHVLCNDPNDAMEKKIKTEWFFEGIYAGKHEIIDNGSMLLIKKPTTIA